MKQLVLGSQSPRRRELMAGLEIPFTCVTIDADESYPPNLAAGDIPLYISRAKARAYARNLNRDQLLITSDTIVWSEGAMLGKPRDEEDAVRMLRQLSGRTHQVYTAVCFTWQDGPAEEWKTEALVDVTDVTFRPLTEEEIRFYVRRFRPLDKAGAYGIQEWIGYVGVTQMTGSYFNVMGFPVSRVYEFLRDHRFI
jgi:septum formation protein